MALDGRIEGLMRQIVRWLVDRDFEAIEKYSRGRRLSADMIRGAVDDYGRTLIMPPDATFSNLDVIEVQTAAVPTWAVGVDLWTKEEGRSDLTLECTVIDSGGKELDAEIDDLHVL